jgi:hypothetical protein
MESQIQSIQEEYYKILAEAFTREDKNKLLTLPRAKLRPYLLERFQSNPLIVPGFDQPISSFEHRFAEVLQTISQFWATRGQDLREALSSTDSYKITLPTQEFILELPENVRRLGVYFDTVVIVDPLHIKERDDVERFLGGGLALKLTLAEHLAYVLRLSALCSKKVDRPLFMIVPNLAQPGSEACADEADAYFARILGNFPSSQRDSHLVELSHGDEENQLRGLITDEQLLSDLLCRFDSRGELIWAEDPSTGKVMLRKITQINEEPLGVQLKAILNGLRGTIFSIEKTLGNALLIGADPIIYNGNLPIYRWYQDRVSDRLRVDLSVYAEEQAAAAALTSKEMTFLEAISLEDLRRIREKGVLEDLRTKLRIERRTLKTKAGEDFTTATTRFSENMFSLVENYGRDYAATQQKNMQKVKSASLKFTASVALGALPFLFPAALVLAIISSGVGVIIGGKSIFDVVNTYRQGKQHIAELSHNPVSIIYGAYKAQTN